MNALPGPPAAKPMADPAPAAVPQLYRWYWRARLPDRHGQLFVVLARGSLNSCLVQFVDGVRYVTSRNALRKARP